MKTCVIFGGSGFIGSFFARHLVEEHGYTKVYLYDNETVERKQFDFRKNMIMSCPQIEVVVGDVREPIEWIPSEPVELVANFAAVHREPGHEPHEYYECNLLGAENVCAWAGQVEGSRIIFSSSIAPYGPSESFKNEQSVPSPSTAYGASKLAAEKIHQIWQAEKVGRQLVIVRPGVVFGPGEGGNVSRLIKAVQSRYFFYMSNRQTRKAGVYVKELCRAMVWVLNSEKSKSDGVTLFNMSMNPGPSIEEYVAAISTVAGIKVWIPNVPSAVLLFAAHAIDAVAGLLLIKHPFSPVRIKKLTRSNNILPTYLVDNGYEYKYTLKEALADWKRDCPTDWG